MFPSVASNYAGFYLVNDRGASQSKFARPNACCQIIKAEIYWKQ